MKEAMFYSKQSDGSVICSLCRFRCHIAEGRRGHCHVRENRGGKLFSLSYGRLVAEHVDPIEKKPLFHVMPGSKSFSIATMGCNFRCRQCQNYNISQLQDNTPLQGIQRSADDVVAAALHTGCCSISYTYTEPTVFYEFALDTARKAKEKDLRNIFVTNGYITKEALNNIAPFLDAANIDLKGYSEEFYHGIIGAKLGEVLDSIITYRQLGIWIELTTLIIPGLNDSYEQLRGIAEFIAANLGKEVPWHVSQFYPTYQLLDRPRTPLSTLRKAVEIGKAAGLQYIYEGNVPGEGGENTWCPQCSELLIKRHGYTIQQNHMHHGACPQCGHNIPGISL